MTVSRSLKQLLRIRSLEEEQSRTSLEFALGELQRIERSLTFNQQRERTGRELVSKSHRDLSPDIEGQGIDRRAGIEESIAACRRIAALAPRLVSQQQRVEELRVAFLAHRVERRQAETLIQEAAVQAEADSLRRAQQGLDDWFGARRNRAASLAAKKQTAPQSWEHPNNGARLERIE